MTNPPIRSWTIRANGPDGWVDHFYADTDRREMEVVEAEPVVEALREFAYVVRDSTNSFEAVAEAAEDIILPLLTQLSEESP